MQNSSDNYKKILKNLDDINERVLHIESYLNISESNFSNTHEIKKTEKITEEQQTSIEFDIGQFWFAKAGIVVLAIGMAIILSLPFNSLPSFLPSSFGFVASFILFGISKIWKDSYNLISRYLFGSAFLLLFFSALRLHYWGSQPFITNPIIEFSLLIIISSLMLFISHKKKSIYLFNLGLTLLTISALVSNETYLIFFTVLILSVLTSYIKINFNWGRLFYYTIFLVYFTHFNWFINNPIFSVSKFSIVQETYSNLFFLMLYLVIIEFGNIYRKSEFGDEKTKVISSFFNSFGFIILFAFINIENFSADITISFISVSILYLLLAFLHWKKGMPKYSIFFFSIFGYSALSIAIINAFEIPELFIWLSWQSILVVSTAILFRSKIIIVANFFIYLSIALATIALSSNSSISFTNMGIVALGSARILNLKKDRLELKTEVMRNAYLIIAFLLLPYSTYLLVPIEYVGLTWLALAIFYYAFSLVLYNKKYRWMAILTLALTILYTLLLGIIHLENELKVLSFVIVGIVLIIISIVYTKIRAKDKKEIEE